MSRISLRTLLLLGVFCTSGSFPLLQAQGKSGLQDAADKAKRAFFHGKQKVKKAVEAQPSLLGNLSDKRITESSGIASSRTTLGVLWTHNDSGDGPYLFAINRRGETLARYTLLGAKNVDWEDIAIGPGADGKPALYVGDIGDNNRTRNDTVLYRVDEPIVDTKQTMQEAKLSPIEKFPYRYPDGKHDAESLMVHPKTGEIFIVSKEASGISGVYTFPMPLQPNLRVTLQKIATLTFTSSLLSGRLAKAETMTTGGDISPDGRRLVIRTYLRAYEWAIALRQTVADALKGKPRIFFLPLTKQGEGICYRADGKTFLTTSEGENSPLYEIPGDNTSPK